MGKIRNDQSGFSLIEVLLALIFLAIVAFIGVYVAHNRDSKPAADSKTETTAKQDSTTQTPKGYNAQDATAFVQKTYDDYLAALNQANGGDKPAAQAGLDAVKDKLSSELYAKAASVTAATPFSCTAQYVTDKYTASLASSDKTTAKVALAISNSSDGQSSTSGMTATVDLTSLKITDVTCPN